MSASRPRLEVVSGGTGPAAESPAVPPPRASSRFAVALGLLLVLSLLVLGGQMQRASRLAGEADALRGQVIGLEAELLGTRARLEAHQQHLAEVRSAVDQLQRLVAQPSAPPDEAL